MLCQNVKLIDRLIVECGSQSCSGWIDMFDGRLKNLITEVIYVTEGR